MGERRLEPVASYDILLVDPPWPYYGTTNKDGAAGKHYDLMTQSEIESLPIRSWLRGHGAVFVWATGPKLHLAIDAVRSWDLHYRGVAFVWVKTRQDGGLIHGQGVPPTATKPTSELVLLATTNRLGRPFPLLNAAVPQVVCAPRGRHSEKPLEIYRHIEALYGDRPRLDVFSRRAIDGWDRWGNEAPE